MKIWKKKLVEKIDLISFGGNPFYRWIGEIEEILPNNWVKIKLYDANNVSSHQLLDAQTMYSWTIDGYKKRVGIKEKIADIQLGLTYCEKNKSELSDSLLQTYYKLKKDLFEYENLLDSLINNEIFKPGTNWNSDIFYTVEVKEVFKNYAIGELHKKRNPWAKIKVGHKLILHK